MVKRAQAGAELVKVEAAIAKLAAAYPDVTEENPWGHRAFKVRGKTFLFLGSDAAGVFFSLKLPASGVAALALDFTEPTHYGLGKSGWVTARFPRARDVPLPLVKEWLAESFEAIAPAKLRKPRTDAPAPSRKAAARSKTARTKHR
jgi:predicted DNA-binding protein (MmcQ/YjbR family)